MYNKREKNKPKKKKQAYYKMEILDVEYLPYLKKSHEKRIQIEIND